MLMLTDQAAVLCIYSHTTYKQRVCIRVDWFGTSLICWSQAILSSFDDRLSGRGLHRLDTSQIAPLPTELRAYQRLIRKTRKRRYIYDFLGLG